MRYLFLILLLAGCATTPYWYRDMPDYNPLATVVVRAETAQELSARCGMYRAADSGCAFRLIVAGRGPTCFVFLGPTANACIENHEKKHCQGWNHDNRPVFRQDCGEI